MNIEFEGRASEGGVSSGFGKSHVTSWEADGTGQIWGSELDAGIWADKGGQALNEEAGCLTVCGRKRGCRVNDNVPGGNREVRWGCWFGEKEKDSVASMSSVHRQQREKTDKQPEMWGSA